MSTADTLAFNSIAELATMLRQENQGLPVSVKKVYITWKQPQLRPGAAFNVMIADTMEPEDPNSLLLTATGHYAILLSKREVGDVIKAEGILSVNKKNNWQILKEDANSGTSQDVQRIARAVAFNQGMQYLGTFEEKITLQEAYEEVIKDIEESGVTRWLTLGRRENTEGGQNDA